LRSRAVSWLTVGLLAAAVAIVVMTAPPPASDRAQIIGSQVRCPVCQGESIADSPAATARNMMDLVELRISEGLSDDEIIDELLSSYGGSLLLDPPARGSTIWLWLAPPLALASGVVMIWKRFRPTEPSIAPPPVRRSTRGRWAWGAAVLAVGGAITIATVAQSQQDRPSPLGLAGVAAGEFDPASVSNETMEAVIAANSEDPAINGMRLALANRYFEAGDYQKAFSHFQLVLDNEPAPAEAANAFTRLGWMVFDGNGETELGLDLIDRGLALVPNDAFALYLKGRIVWCGQGDPYQASDVFTSVLTVPGLGEDVRSAVESDLTAAAAGRACP